MSLTGRDQFGDLAVAVDAVLADPTFTERAREVAADIARLPPVAAGVGVLERIAADPPTAGG